MNYKELLESTIELHNRLHPDGMKYNIVHTPEHTIVKGKFVFKESVGQQTSQIIDHASDTEIRCRNIVKTLLISGLLNYKI